MKTVLFLLGFLGCIAGTAQQVRLVTKDGKQLETRIRAVSDQLLFTDAGNITFSAIAAVSFEARTEQDQTTYTHLEKAGIIITFNYTFDSTVVPVRKISDAEVEQLRASEAGRIKNLYAENLKSHKHWPLVVGQSVRYQVIGSEALVKAVITGFTTSTISFERKTSGSITLLQTELKTLYVKRTAGRRIGGTVLILAGTAGVIVGTSYSGSSGSGGFASGIGAAVNEAAKATMLVGLAATVGGIVLMQPKKIDLQKSYRMKTTK